MAGSRLANRRLRGGKCSYNETQETHVTNRRPKETKEKDLYNRKYFLHERTISLETLHLKKVR